MSYGEGSNGAVSFKIINPAASSSASTSSRTQPVASTSSGSQHHHNRAQHSRHHRPHQRYRSDSEESEDEDGHGFQRRRAKDESIVGIDDRGIKTSSSSRKERPLVIQSAPNKDFRRAAMELRAKKEGRQQFVPGQERDDGKAKRVLTDAERRFLESGSNVQRTGDRVMTGGIRQRQSPANGQSGGVEMEAGDKTPVMRPSGLSTMPDLDTLTPAVDADTLALRELLQDQNEEEHQTKVHVIPQVDSAVTEEEAYAIDVASRPDTPDLEAYQRVPIEDFGAALLRGMGGGSKKPRPKVEAWVPKARTALLGIGAKSREETFGADWVAQQDGAKKGSNKREQMKFMPLQRVERAPSSGSASPAPRPVENGRSEEISSSRRKRDEEDRYALEEVDGRHRKSRRRSYEGSDKDDGSRHGDSRHRERSRSPRSDKRDRERHRDHDSRAHRDDSNRDRYSKDRDWPRDRDGNRTRERDRESSKLRERKDYRSREPWQ